MRQENGKFIKKKGTKKCRLRRKREKIAGKTPTPHLSFNKTMPPGCIRDGGNSYLHVLHNRKN
jgi:hypothetical protein